MELFDEVKLKHVYKQVAKFLHEYFSHMKDDLPLYVENAHVAKFIDAVLALHHQEQQEVENMSVGNSTAYGGLS